MIYLIIVIGLYTFIGNSGILSFGHISFMTIGAYASILLTIPPAIKGYLLPDLPGILANFETGLVPATLVAALIATFVALIASFPILRFSGVQAALVTLSMLIIVHVVALNWDSVTNGASVMTGVPAYTSLAVATEWAVMALVIAFLYQQSKYGRRLRAAADDPVAAAAVGINVVRERRRAFILSAPICSVGGSLWAHLVAGFNPDAFYFSITFVTIAMLIIGGMRSLAGAVVGTGVVTALTELLRAVENASIPVISVGGLSEFGLAAAMIIILIARPKGLTAGKEIPWPGRFGRYIDYDELSAAAIATEIGRPPEAGSVGIKRTGDRGSTRTRV
jgi:branched-chain amino acid transport system permease protein